MSPYEPLYKVPRTTEACTGGVQKTFGSRLRHGCAARCCQRQARGKKRARNSLMGLEPAIGLEPMTCALRVRRTASRRSRHLSLLSQKPHHSWGLFKQQDATEIPDQLRERCQLGIVLQGCYEP